MPLFCVALSFRLAPPIHASMLTELEQTLLRSNNRHLTSGVEARRVKIENRSIDSTFSSYSPDFFLFCALFLRSEGLSILHGPNEGSA